MAKQTIDIGSTPNDGTGSTLRAGGDLINDNFTELYRGPNGSNNEVQYVSKSGDDSADGHTWANAVATIDQAFTNLPTRGSGSNAHAYGTIYMGSGSFETAGSLPLRANVHIYGTGCQNSTDQGGTEIVLADGAEAHMFDYGSFDDWAHNVLLQDLTLNGNKANQSGTFDLLRLYRPGFNCRLRSVYFKQSSQYGIYLAKDAVNFYTFDCTGSGCDDSFLYFNHEQSTASIGMYGTQIDNCGTRAIQVISSLGAVSQPTAGHMSIIDLEFETTTAGLHDSVIYAECTTSSYTRMFFNIQNVTGFGPGGSPTAIIHEGSGSDYATFAIRNVRASGGYPVGFQSDETGETNVTVDDEAAIIHEFHTGDRGLQHGSVVVFQGAGTPEGSKSAPTGSLYLRNDGGASTSFYVKESGTTSSGWVAK